MNNTECSPLQCCENSTTIVPNESTTTPRNKHFHRRSSVGLSPVDVDSESETEQKNGLIKNSGALVSSAPMTNSSVVITVNNEK